MTKTSAIIAYLVMACASVPPKPPALDHFACLERGIQPDPYLAAEWRAAKAKWKGLRDHTQPQEATQ